ncbi:hypothetical protein EJ06DRAFT_187454 [Trichodelitschia bisporula]|uniref:C2H2-type domain-containing protein n=1 Tax=Trichodelitschia bisporula TaxID=703511 RepID=A0A6G1I7B5_9PEZI|nr:hypothetical protein EJ06DRAFT_187454 [Trichodelitschia bisporula]
MGKKKRKFPSLEEILQRPWCYYCERDFGDLKILISHQKAKHFKCERCNRRLNTAGGLSVHMNQVHKEQLNSVENALANRQGLEVEIFGMEGIPDEVKAQHDARITQQYWEEQAARRATTGNPTPGGASGHTIKRKKAKIESKEEIEKRLETYLRQVEQGIPMSEIMEGIETAPETVPTPVAQQPFQAPQTSPPPFANHPFQAPFAPPFAQQQAPFQPPFPVPVQPFSGPPMAGAPFPPVPGFSPPGGQPFPPPFHTPTPPFAQGAPPPPRQGSGSAPALPQRPQFSAPPVNAAQFQQMHQGAAPSHTVTQGAVDELISSARQSAQAEEATQTASKPKKEKNTRMVYADNEISPEEKMAQLPKYQFTRGAREQQGSVLRSATGTVGAGATGVVRE